MFGMLLFSSCQKEELVLSENMNENSIETNIRNSEVCPNLIQNGNFELGDEEAHAFYNGTVTDWDCWRSSADLVGPTWDWGGNFQLDIG